MPLRHAIRLSLILFAVAQVLPAAVDCRHPRTRQQRVVCANPELLNLDQQLSGDFERALAAASGAERRKLEYDQTDWEDGSGGCWEQVDCLRKRYVDRIAVLEAQEAEQAARAQAVEVARRQVEASYHAERLRMEAQGQNKTDGPIGDAAASPDAEPSAAEGHPNDTGAAPGESEMASQDAALASAKEAAKQALTRARELLNQAQGYEKKGLVADAQDRLAVALTWDNVDEIKAKTEALALFNKDLDQFIQRQAAQTPGTARLDGAGSAGQSSPYTNAEVRRPTSRDWTPLVVVLLGVDWVYCLFQGLRNRLVLYFDWLDVFVSVLGPLLLCASVALSDTSDRALVGLLAVAGTACAVVTVRLSIKHNGAVLVGCAVALFKLSFSFLWFALLFGQLGRGADQRKSGSERLRETLFGLVIGVLLFGLMKRLINGRVVYAMNGRQA